MKKISIIVPCYNASKYIDKSVESLLNQTFKDVEIILVDDGSTDDTKKKIKAYEKKNPKTVKSLILKKNGGLGNARNEGMKKAKGEYLYFLDSDDYIDNNTLEEAYNKAKEDDAEIVEFDFIWEYPSRNIIDTGKDYKNARQMIKDVRVVAWNKLYKRTFINKTKAQFAVGLRYEDILFTYQYAPYVKRVSFVRKPFLHYIQRTDSISNTQTIKVREIYDVLNQTYDFYKEKKLLKKYKSELEYRFISFILGSSYKRAANIKDKKVRKEVLEEGWKLLHEKFPTWKENEYLKEKSNRNRYFKMMNYFLYMNITFFFKETRFKLKKSKPKSQEKTQTEKKVKKVSTKKENKFKIFLTGIFQKKKTKKVKKTPTKKEVKTTVEKKQVKPSKYSNHKILKHFTYENFIYLFILLSPFFDILAAQTSLGDFSVATFTRPIMPVVMLILIYIKDKEVRFPFVLGAVAYLGYSLIHILGYTYAMGGSSYGGLIYEFSYSTNYTYLIFILFLFIYVFKRIEKNKLPFFMTIYSAIYIASIYISMLTRTSTSTYLEGVGEKGWFNTGGAVAAVLVLSLCVILPYIVKSKKWIIPKIGLVMAIGIYLTLHIGNRTGFYGVVIIGTLFIVFMFLGYLIKRKNTKILITSIAGFAALIIVVVTFGSSTFLRREQLDELSNINPEDPEGPPIYIALELMKAKEQYENEDLSIRYFNKEQKEALDYLYDYSEKHELSSIDYRQQQLIYHTRLYQLQDSVMYKLFGNGYLTNIGMLTLEMETLALFYNFGIIGFLIFMGPFLYIFGYGVYKAFIKRKKLKVDFLMLLVGAGLSYGISTFAGHTYFNSAVMLVIVVIHAMIYLKAKEL